VTEHIFCAHKNRVADLEHKIGLLIEENKCASLPWGGGSTTAGGLSELQLENERLAKEVYLMSKELAKATSLGVTKSWLDKCVFLLLIVLVCEKLLELIGKRYRLHPMVLSCESLNSALKA
jgi:hypothetical protein